MGISGRNFKKRDKQAGEKALERHLSNVRLWGLKGHEKIGVLPTTMTSTLKCAHSKALESGCLSRFYVPPFVTMQSHGDRSDNHRLPFRSYGRGVWI